ncbi:choline BCCT transporter BetT [Thiorhodococcus fuscus]|uniref:Choline BCCT transporter BetT n=1 Tax=Thiorhodococcus fuscus TaxID=527200 RepID=A0ABW4Y6N0_9GAMM
MSNPPDLIEKAPALSLNRRVFVASTVLTFTLIAITMLFPTRMESLLGQALTWVSNDFGWYYMLVMAAYSGFVLFIGFSRHGDIRLGPDHAQPDFNYVTWAAMLFSAGIGIDLLFFGASEPLAHYLTPPGGDTGLLKPERQAIAQTFLHWGLHGWGVYALVGMTLAYFAYRHKMPLALRSALVPLIGEERARGWMGDAVDTFGIVCTLFGIATSLGIGVLQANAGMTHIFGIESSKLVQAGIIIAVIAMATLSAISGVERGVRRLSEINMGFATLLLLALLIMGPTLFLLNALVENIGDYFQTLMVKTFDVYAYQGEEGEAWKAGWTVFFWAWWLAWSPFVGLFIARISRGRTLREFVFGVMFIPLGFIFAWFSIFGNSAIDLVANHGAVELGQIATENPAMGLFALFDQYPLSSVWSVLAVILGLIFFVTSADSGALVLANLSTRGLTSESDAPIWLRSFWAVLTGLITLGLLFAGGFNSLQSVVVVSALPFSLVLILFMWSLHYSLRQEATKLKAGNIDFAPAIPAAGLGWKERLSRIVHFPSRQLVVRFMTETVYPAMEEVATALNQRGLDTDLAYDESSGQINLCIRHGEEMDFVYRVHLVGSLKPVFALGLSGGIVKHAEQEQYYRAEVFLREGSREYDLVGYTKSQVINDILNQYERHMQFLHLDR